MRIPDPEYRKLRLSRIANPERRHILLLLSWIIYFLFYFLTENLIPPERCTPVHCLLDDLVPFCEWFVIPYVSWYFLVAGSLGYFLLRDKESFRKLQTYIIITQIIATAVYIFFPNRQDLRPEVFPRDNFAADILALLYTIDTNTGVCPSLHVAYSLGIASTWLRYRSAPPAWRITVAVWCSIICLSVAFVKQHSVVDIFAALPVCLIAEWFVFYRKQTKQRNPPLQSDI